MCNIEWLPELVLLEDYYGDWNFYLNALYNYFCQDFVRSKPIFMGVRLGLKRHPVLQGKEATFWHMISEGRVEEERIPDFRRCERIRWPRPIIEYSPNDNIKIWENRRGSETRILLWLEEYDYLVILAKRKNFILPWTAYHIEYKSQRQKYQKEYEKYINKNGMTYQLEM
jgi:hypothetical protein